MKDQDEDIDRRLDRLARATEGIGPRPDFSARVARAIEGEQRGGLLVELGRPARRILPALALAAAVSLVWAVESDQAFDDALSVYADETVELEW
ncbi:MAG TPA: hypothetical protein VK550_11100 [Polyangiaceae bacterium]|nr:hypothetical protein [Polyangiaceae bacterium]